MGHKVDPTGLRTAVIFGWKSRWYGKGIGYLKNLRQDIVIRNELKKMLRQALISSIEIERSVAKIRIIIRAGRPGVLIGRSGQGIEDLKKKIRKKYFLKEKLDVQVDVKEVKEINADAQIMADEAAFQLEKRTPFRKVMKSFLEKSMQSRMVKGAKIRLSGRLGGAEMSRVEWLSKGTLPLHTLKADIDFAKSTAFTTFGTLGVKIWLYKGEKEAVNQNGRNR